ENNVAAVSTEIVPGADLAVAVTLDGARTSTAIMTVTNNGPDRAMAVQAYDTSLGTTILSASATTGACTFEAFSPNCSLGDLEPGASATVSVRYRILPGGKSIANLAAASSNTPDPRQDNNYAQADLTFPGAQTYHDSTSFPVAIGVYVPCADDFV